MSIDKLGFFSPDVERFRTFVRAAPNSREWFELTDEIIRIGAGILCELQIETEGRSLFSAAVLARCHETVQGAVLLLERGMIGPARALLRTAVEDAIALHGLAEDPTFTSKLVSDHNLRALKLANVLLQPGFRNGLSPEDIASLEATRSEISALEEADRRGINWADVAINSGCPEIYQTLYRMLSSDGAHVSMSVLSRRYELDERGQIKHLKVGPDTDGLVFALHMSCAALLSALEPFSRFRPSKDHDAKTAECIARFKKMRVDEIVV